MSFDTELDYTFNVTMFNTKINYLQNIIDTNTVTITQLQAAPYPSVTAAEITRMQNQNSAHLLKIQNYQAILTEIARIQALTVEEKALIYYYYTILDVEKKYYMIKMLFNTNMLTDSNVLALYNDNVTDAPTKLIIAKIIYNQISNSNLYNEIYDL